VNNPVILTEKLRRPDPAGLSRSRLEAPLLQGGASRLDLIVAPPGSGKTTLLAQVAATAAASAIPIAWYRVTGNDSAEATLVAHLGRALRDALGIPANPTSVTDLLAELEEWSGASAILILDDLHEIAGSAAERSLEQFVELRPHRLRVLAGSRRQPEMNIPRLRVSGLLHELSNDDLRFRSWEVEELFISVFREPLSPESAAALTRRTGGWAAGLQLFHLANSGRTVADRQRAVDDLGGRSKLVRSYLARNVLAELPEHRREFLLRTCTLGTLTGELCDALLETTGSRRVLDEFEQQQLFTSSEDDGETFRYHEVLRTHLEWALVEEYGAAGARQWYSRSAALLESIGDQRAAVRAYARAEDWGAVARLIQARGSGPDDGVAGTDLLLPASVVEHDPWLTLAEARRRVREGALGAAMEKFRQAERLLDEPEFRERCRRERSVAALWTAGAPVGTGRMFDGRADSRHWSVQIRAATARGASAAGPGKNARSDGPGVDRPGTPAEDLPDRLGRGIAALLAGEFSWARTIVNSVENDRSADSTLKLLAQLGATVIDLVTVGCDDPSTRLGQIALDAELAGLPWVARLARGLGEAALVALGSPAWRLTACVELLGECERAGDDWGAALLRLAAAIAGQLADPAADPDEFTDAASRFRRLEAPVLALWAESLLACVLARDGRPGAGEFAHRVATQARALHLDGAQALAIAALAVAAGGDQRPAGIVIGDTANTEGMRGAMRLLTGRARSTIVAAQPVPAPEPGAFAVPSASSTSPHVVRSAERPAIPSPDNAVQSGAAGPPPLVRVQCFGGFGIEVDGVSVDLGQLRPRARALLRLLALTPDRDVHREHLVDALWPGVDLTIGTRRLQVAVSSVRQVLEQAGLPGSEVVARRGDAYRLALPPAGTIDVLEFERSLREAAQAAFHGDTAASMAARQAALALYRGDVLPEDGPAEYVVADRERLRLAAAAAAAALAQDSRTLGHPRQALAAARLSVQLDRFQDLGWELLVELHEQAGDNSAAERARQEHAQAQAELESAVT
jgi:DNA-binding SARP family transcriptional activator